MRRYPSRTRELSYAFGPGPLSSAIKALITVNVVLFLASYIVPINELLGLRPVDVVAGLQLWRPVTYMFAHGNIAHILFNMLALWMFGTELERLWGTRFFLRYYFATGIAAGASTIIVSLLLGSSNPLYHTLTIGASGAIYGLLLAFGITYPDRPIYMYLLFPLPAKYFVMIVGAIALMSAMGDRGSGIAHITHLGGLVAGYLILRGRRIRPATELKYWYLRWKMNRARKKFGIYSGGRHDDWDRRIH
jgi:membrane associated rhomboid family serine protease